jgi:hypothetical protein
MLSWSKRRGSIQERERAIIAGVLVLILVMVAVQVERAVYLKAG